MSERYTTLVKELRLDDEELVQRLHDLLGCEPTTCARAMGLTRAAWLSLEDAAAVLSRRGTIAFPPTVENLAALFLFLHLRGA